MKKMKHFLQKLDLFGAPFSFSYKNSYKYYTSLGGLLVVIFSFFAISIEIYYFIPFYNRKNFTFVYYSMNLYKTETIKLKDSQLVMAIGLDCQEDKNGTKAEDILKYELKYTINRKNKDGIITKEKKTVSTHSCDFSDFPENFNDSIHYVNIEKYRCADKMDNEIRGIYTDEVFSYYEFEIASKEDSQSNYDKIDKYLTKNDCKLQIYYTDITIDVNDYEEPIKPFLNTFFIQLNPTLFIKSNAFIMNQYFINDNLLIYILKNEKPIIKTTFSRHEQYSIYKGMNRFESKPVEYNIYAKVYIRADTIKTEIKRKYQKLIEFYANSSSITRGLAYILFAIIRFFNSFYAHHSISKKLFFFKEIKNNHIDILKKNKQIKKLIGLTEEFKKLDNKKNIRIKTENKNEKKLCKIKDNKIKDKNNKKINETTPIRNYLSYSALENLNSDLNSKSTITKKDFDKYIIKQPKKIKYSFNIFEIVFKKFFFYCCLTKKLKFKDNLNIKSNNILCEKIDIVSFARNMILFDIIYHCILDTNKREIIKFLSQPIISFNKKEEIRFDKTQDYYYKYDFDRLNNDISKLVFKSKMNKKEMKLISLSNKKLKELI